MLCHSFTTEAYLRERTLPALRCRARDPGRLHALPASARRSSAATTRLGRQAETAVRAQIAFYGSTPSYRPVLDLHGWGELHEQLNQLSRRQEWAAMGELITDDVLDAFAVSGTPAEVAATVQQRFGDVIDRISLYTPHDPDRAERRCGDRGTARGSVSRAWRRLRIHWTTRPGPRCLARRHTWPSGAVPCCATRPTWPRSSRCRTSPGRPTGPTWQGWFGQAASPRRPALLPNRRQAGMS